MTLEKTVKSIVRELERHAEATVRRSIKSNTLRMWNGRKVVTLDQWKKFEFDFDHVFEYIPDDFIQHSMIYNWRLGKEFDKKRDSWFKDYIDFLTNKKNPTLGKYKCRYCILNPSAEIKTANSIQDILVKYIVSTKISFPCQVVNIFKCPYEQESKDYSLLYLGCIWKIVNDALVYAYHRTTYDNTKLIEVDFEKDRAIQHNGWLANQSSNVESVRSALRFLRLSQVPVKETKDIFDVITNRKTLDLLLEQYIESLTDNYEYLEERKKKSEEAEFIKEIKNYIISLFMKIKNKIKLEDLRGIHNETPEKEEKERQRLISVREYLKKEYPSEAEAAEKIIRSGKCDSCSGFANIHCTNCDIWICDKHWKEHGTSKHNMKLEDSS